MLPQIIRAVAFVIGLLCYAGYKQAKKPVENVDAQEKDMAALLKVAPDPVQKEIDAFRLAMHENLGERRFDELEKVAEELRTTNAVFRNGDPKIADFYEGLGVRSDAKDEHWEKAEELQKAWIAAKPASITARLAYAQFFSSYAWRARGSGYADTITPLGAQLFSERLTDAAKQLQEARQLEGNDPMWWQIALRVGIGQGWAPGDFEMIVDDAHKFDPKFWRYDISRAYSLLPRWYGEPGDWEEYAEDTSDRADGLGDEIYARIVMELASFHENIFRDTKASWPRTRDGLAILRKKYPDAIEFAHYHAILATMAFDRPEAKAAFEPLGDAYIPHIWESPERFVHYRTWAETGTW